jgi:hypothetical protein
MERTVAFVHADRDGGDRMHDDARAVVDRDGARPQVGRRRRREEEGDRENGAELRHG